jgi:mono/diheme cytochrome c family protein
MPAWGAALKESQVRAIVAYIRTLSSDETKTIQNTADAK